MNSVAFLKAFHPDGPWVLTAIRIDRKGIETKTFGPDTDQDCAKWIKTKNGNQNLYFCVNTPGRSMSKKPSREDIVAVPWLHVDIDARAGEKLPSELERIKVLVTEGCPIAKPTLVIFSGGGYQAFWKLKQPIGINSLDNALDTARYNQQLEVVFGGDSCHNIDRIMRLPGTMNLPDAKKIQKGRVPTEAEVYSYDPEAVYELTEFMQAPEVQVAGVTTAPMVNIPTANVERLDVDDLEKWKVPDRVRMVIVQGHDPDTPKEGDNSRSAWLFDVVCQLVRCDVPDDVIYSVITDPNFAIAASVLDKGNNTDKYAFKQINSAKEFVEEPWLRKLNEKFIIIGNLGGRCRVVEEVHDPVMKRTRLTKQTFGDFRNRFANAFIQITEKKSVTVANWWIQHPHRRQFEHLVFRPNGNDPEAYNLWQGFGCQAIPGTKHESYLEHLKVNICRDSESNYEYLVGWMARAVQKPDEPGHSAIVLRGASGTGKSFFATHFGHLWGRHFLQVSDAKHLVGAFNSHLRDTVILFGDEAFFAGDRRHEATLKTLITERSMIIEAKGVDAEVSPNFVHLILASNSDWVVPTGPTERRFLVLDVGDSHKQDIHYFRDIVGDLKGGGYESLLHYLLQYDLTGFDVRKVPGTAALMDQKIYSMTPMAEWWYWRLNEGTLLKAHDAWMVDVLCEELYEDYLNHARRFNTQRLGTNTVLGRFLGSVCPDTWPKRTRRVTGNSRPYYYQFPQLKHLRDKWVELYGQVEWSAPVDAAVQPTLGDEPF